MSQSFSAATLPETLAHQLRRAILGGQLGSDDDLSQNALATAHKMSRIPVREALRLLEAEGLVVIDANRGARVRTITRAEIEEIFHLRLLLECDCLRAAAPRFSDAEIETLDRIRKRAELDAGTPEWSDGDWRFHEALYRPSRRSRQISLIYDLRQHSRLYAAAHESLPRAKTRWLRDHTDIVRAVANRDVRAAVTHLRDHLEAARDHILAAHRIGS